MKQSQATPAHAERLGREEYERSQDPLLEVCKFCKCRKGALIHKQHAFIPTGRFNKHTDATNRREMPCETCTALDRAATPQPLTTATNGVPF